MSLWTLNTFLLNGLKIICQNFINKENNIIFNKQIFYPYFWKRAFLQNTSAELLPLGLIWNLYEVLSEKLQHLFKT